MNNNLIFPMEQENPIKKNIKKNNTRKFNLKNYKMNKTNKLKYRNKYLARPLGISKQPFNTMNNRTKKLMKNYYQRNFF